MNKLAQLIVWSGTRPRPSSARVTPNAFGCTYEDVCFLSSCEDAVSLSGWLVRAEADANGSVILCHGHTSTRSEMLKLAVMLSKHHFTTLLFDFRARGMSAGSACTMGYLEMYDVIGAIEYLKSRADLRHWPICLIGNSMGGSASIRAAALDNRVASVVAEATYARLANVVKQRLGLATGPLASRMARECAAIGRLAYNLDIASVNPAAVIASISPRPVLLITDGLDITCTRSESDALFEAAREPKERWIAKAAPHVCAFRVYPELYEQKVVDFLERAVS